jgi:hypothetical protein
MLMPKTPMHEDCLLAPSEYDIGRSGEVSAVQPEAVTQSM